MKKTNRHRAEKDSPESPDSQAGVGRAASGRRRGSFVRVCRVLARGNSARSRQSLFRLSGPVSGRPRGATRWAVGERTPPGVPDYHLADPMAPGGVSGRLGAERGAEVGPVNDDMEVTP